MRPRQEELREALDETRPLIVRAGKFSFLSALMVLAPSVYMLEVYDRVVNSRSTTTLLMLTILVIGVYVVMEVLEWARSRLLHGAGLHLDRKLAARVFDAMLAANQRRLPGGTAQSMSDLRAVREFLASPAASAAFEAPASLVFLAVVFFIHPALGWAALAGGLLQLLIGWFNERATQPALAAASQASTHAQAHADATVRNVHWIDAMGMQGARRRIWLERQRRFLQLQGRASLSAGGYMALTKFVQVVMGSLLLGLGAWLLLGGHFPQGAGVLIVASVLGARVLAPLTVLILHWRAVIQFRHAWTRLDGLLRMVPPPAPTMALPRPRGVLQVENVSLLVPGSNVPILSGVVFGLQPGDVLAVLGPSASGKSSLARILVGLWRADSGAVRLDGADVYAWNKAELGAWLGYLPQEVELLEGTIAENIARFGMVDMDKVTTAARAAGCEDFVDALPEGLETPVGPDGSLLSAGQRQRIGLARALYDEPAFVVLDEPDASLDEAGEAALVHSLQALQARGATCVVVTHRMRLLSVSNKVLMLRDGQVQAFGPREQVFSALQRMASGAGRPRGSTLTAENVSTVAEPQS